MKLLNRQKGLAGEALAQRFLEGKGLKIIEKNWRSRWGEIDLIVQKGDQLIFVEVKRRSSLHYGKGLEAVGGLKQRKMLKTALFYLQKNRIQHSDIRFAVLSIDGSEDSKVLEFVEFPLDGMDRYY